MKQFFLVGAIAFFGMVNFVSGANLPAWWSGIIQSGVPERNFAPLNSGQLKFVAFKAKAYLDANLSGGSGPAVTTMVNGFSTTGNLKPVTIGQLKAVAKPFYDRLMAAGFFTKINLIAHGYPSNWTDAYPWNSVTPVPVAKNYAPANIGQLKVIFSFDVFDADGDSLLDSYESATTGQSGGDGSWLWTLNGNDGADADGDGISDLAESQMGWNPTSNDLNNARKTETLSYDGAHRLKNITGRSSLGYTPDEAGNLIQATQP